MNHLSKYITTLRNIVRHILILAVSLPLRHVCHVTISKASLSWKGNIRASVTINALIWNHSRIIIWLYQKAFFLEAICTLNRLCRKQESNTHSARIFSTLEVASTIHARLYTSFSVVPVYIAAGVVGDKGHDDDLKNLRHGLLRVSQKTPATRGTYQAIRSNILPQWDCFHSGIVCREARTHLQTCHVCPYLLLTVNLGYIIGSSVSIFTICSTRRLCGKISVEKGKFVQVSCRMLKCEGTGQDSKHIFSVSQSI